MTNFDIIYQRIIKHEGYYANVTGDKGGETYMGIARNMNKQWEGWTKIDEYKKNHTIAHNQKLTILGLDESVRTFYKILWYKKGIHLINDFSLQYIIYDWVINSGNIAIKQIQKVLGCKVDGMLGRITADAINYYEPRNLFNKIKVIRIEFYERIALKGSNAKFLKGWLKRINSINYEQHKN